MSKKGNYQPLDQITHKMQGWWLITFVNGEEWKRENLIISNRMVKSIKEYNTQMDEVIKVEAEGSGEELETNPLLVKKMAETYCSVKKKYTGKNSTYKSNGKYWKAFENASAICSKYDLDAYTYIMIIVKHYTTRIKENRVAFPWPNQIGGSHAEEIIGNHVANNSKDIPPEVIARRMAQAKRNLPLDKDEYFIEAKKRFKTRNFDRKDFEYVKIRYNQVGETPDWLDRFEKILEERGE